MIVSLKQQKIPLNKVINRRGKTIGYVKRVEAWLLFNPLLVVFIGVLVWDRDFQA